eukprot:TRINITY_DN101146_c0_g1_i1.p1 TRINITY_DN101146_c0_g1~~TRINITY_DN101146_c0_g1_i1.p1  ORF type:complete len:340 (-),score=73.23 TRINITY_DN101146_c0_g1_i1:78-1001(-)
MPAGLAPLVPPLQLNRRNVGSAPTPGTRSARNKEPSYLLTSDRRYLEKPQVGLGAAAAALGEVPAPWSNRSVNSGRPECMLAQRLVTPDKKSKPYNPGALRARGQLLLALHTNDENCQLRRLEKVLGIGSCRFDYGMKRQLGKAQYRQKELSTQLKKKTADGRYNLPKVVAVEGEKDDNTEQEEPVISAEKEEAATRIQAAQRGKMGRQRVAKLREDAAVQGDEQEAYVFFCESDESSQNVIRLSGGDEGEVHMQADLGGGLGEYRGTYKLWIDGENPDSEIEIELEDGSRLTTTVNWDTMTYMAFV